MRKLEGDLSDRDLWTPRDLSLFLGVDYKTALGVIKRLRHLRTGRRYLVSRSVVLRELGLDGSGVPLQTDQVHGVV